jgi:uncharacterized protein (UPF0303 family)
MMSQVPELIADVPELEEQFSSLHFQELSHQDALSIGLDLAERAEERGWPMVIAVFLGDQRIFQYACEGTSAENDQWIARKRNTVLTFQQPSFLVGQRFASEGKNFYEETGLNPEEYVCYGGGFPLIVGNDMVGMVLTSGVPHQDDHGIIVEALRSFIDS